MLVTMRKHDAFRLIHGRFRPLKDKLEMVRSWPGVKGGMIDSAQKEAESRIARFNAESQNNNMLNIVVSPYLGDGLAHELLPYARDRMRDTFGTDFWQWDLAYASGIDENRVRYLQDEGGNTIVPVYRDCVRIEVVDLGAHFNRKDGTVAKAVRGKDSAHFAVFYAAAQDPDWVRQIDGDTVPWVLACGLELNVPDCDAWMDSPSVDRHSDWARLDARRLDDWFYFTSLSVLWE
ncbi:MAG: hypothetical protein Q8P30_03935 [Candidatus Uhrbacteria bacterium]|nr:hypothetical protein [Candidatus Uhrbacteria bacterium]